MLVALNDSETKKIQQSAFFFGKIGFFCGSLAGAYANQNKLLIKSRECSEWLSLIEDMVFAAPLCSEIGFAVGIIFGFYKVLLDRMVDFFKECLIETLPLVCP